MSGLELVQQHMLGQPAKPPIHLWQPPLSGDIDIVILANGDWVHEGDRINRLTLVKLFSSILRRENDDDYYLVTPVEKWRVKVIDTAFFIVDMDVLNVGVSDQQIIFTSNVEDKYLLSKKYPLSVTINSATKEPHPIINLDNGLTARLSRSVFYRMVDCAIERDAVLSVLSDHSWFELGKIQE